MINSPVEEIKSRLDIVELIQGYIRLQKSGINYRAVCPFHTEKTPSFFVSPSRQIWHCFGGCGEGGDIFKFVMKIEGLDFPEALRLLAQRAGVILKREDPAISSERNRLYDLCEEAARTFEKNLSLTPAVQTYLKKRGVTEATAKEFRLGFAPQSWDFLLKTLAQKGFKKEEIEKAGLAIKSEDKSSHYDRFRSRIMFPITDSNARVIGFGGRVFSTTPEGQKSTTAPAEAKYVNTPNTLIYDKSRALYGFDKAKQEIRSQNQVVAVEGYMDCLMSHQAGVKNTIAVSGTALTGEQLKSLRRLCETIISSFDTDAAGESATKRSLALATQFGFERKIAAIPLGKPSNTTLTAAEGGRNEVVKVDILGKPGNTTSAVPTEVGTITKVAEVDIPGKDPADLILFDPKLWVNAVEEAKPVVDFYFAKTFREQDPRTANGKKEISAVLLPLLAELTNEIERAHWAGELARLLNVREDTVWKELEKKIGHQQDRGGKTEAEERRLPTRRELLEERLLTLLTLVKEDTKKQELENHYLIFTSAENKELFDVLRNNYEPKAVTAGTKEKLDLLKFKGEALAEITNNLEEEFLACKRELEREGVKERLLKIGSDIEQLEKEGRGVEVTSLLQDFRSLSEKLKILS